MPLDARQTERLAGALRGRLKRDVRLHCRTDARLIGGAIVRAGDLLIDGSLKGKLARLEIELTGEKTLLPAARAARAPEGTSTCPSRLPRSAT